MVQNNEHHSARTYTFLTELRQTATTTAAIVILEFSRL